MRVALSGKCGTIDGAERCVNTPRPLTRSLDLSKEGLAMKATQCAIDDCDKPVEVRGWCRPHYARWQRHGDPAGKPEVDYEARFWSRVDRRGPDECWPWLGTIFGGYGQFWCPPKRHPAHRFAYESAVGPIPDGLTIDHVKARGCVLKHCVNPAHLEPVTIQENTRRGESMSVLNARKTCCPKCGAEYRRVGNERGRRCRPCTLERMRVYRQRKREAT